MSADIASFSFDGESAKTIVLDPSYADYDFGWHYSIDGGNTISAQILDHSFTLSEDEIARVNSEDDIRIYIDGMPGDAYVYTIDIVDGTLSDLLYGNDLENRVIGVDTTYEWSDSENGPWTSYADASPNNTGDKTLYVRHAAHGNATTSEVASFEFTADNQPETRKYVPVSHLSVHAFSTESTKDKAYATNSIDGNYNTFWYNNVSNRDTAPSITLKLDKPRYVSSVEIVPQLLNGYGRLKAGTMYGSTDGENWNALVEFSDLPADYETLVLDVDDPQEVTYIRIDADTTNFNNFFFAKMFNVFQDLSKNPRPTGGVGYAPASPTNGEVIARLLNISCQNYRITSDGGDTHTFTDNGEFTFTFVDEDTGLEGSVTAVVDWIDKIAPTATIRYDISTTTNKTVTATLVPDEEVTVLNNGEYSFDEDGLVYDADGNLMEGWTADEDGNIFDADGTPTGTNINQLTHEFIDNGEFTFEFMDAAGNRGSATASVDWIDLEAPVAMVRYDIDSLTNQSVTATVSFDEDATVTNGDGTNSFTFNENGSYTFVFEDAAGNVGTITATVNWIDKTAPTAELEYDYSDAEKVSVRVVNTSEVVDYEIGEGYYEFTENGNYEIVIRDKAGNKTSLWAVIDVFKDDNDGNDGDKEDPDNPSNPDNPDKPDQPDNPDNPDQPENPDKPDTPDQPENPDNPDKPDPGKPDVPDQPTGPDNPDDPTKPDTPDNPDKPIVRPGDEDQKDPTLPDKPVEAPEYKAFYFKTLSVYVPVHVLGAGTEVVIEEIIDEWSGLGSVVKGYRVSIIDSEGNEISLSGQDKIKISCTRMGKSIEGVYKLVNGELVPVEWTLNGDEIEFMDTASGSYVFAYGDSSEGDETLPDTNNVPNNSSTGDPQASAIAQTGDTQALVTFVVLALAIAVASVLRIFRRN